MSDYQRISEWIVSRYGPIGEKNFGAVCEATVPVWKGTAHGIGQTPTLALWALYCDLVLHDYRQLAPPTGASPS